MNENLATEMKLDLLQKQIENLQEQINILHQICKCNQVQNKDTNS